LLSSYPVIVLELILPHAISLTSNKSPSPNLLYIVGIGDGLSIPLPKPNVIILFGIGDGLSIPLPNVIILFGIKIGDSNLLSDVNIGIGEKRSGS